MAEIVQVCIQSCFYVFCSCFAYQQSREYITQSPISSIDYKGVRSDSMHSLEIDDMIGVEKSDYKPLHMNTNPIGGKEIRFNVV